MKTKIAKRALSWLLSVLMILSSVIVGFSGITPLSLKAFAAYSENTVTTSTTSFGNAVYKVTSNVTITGSTDSPGITVQSGATAILYIAPGCTLTVTGGVGSTAGNGHSPGTKYNDYAPGGAGGKGGQPGIYLPSGATLIVTGGGTLKATGGKGGKAGQGGTGGKAVGWSENSNYDNYADPGDGGGGGGGAGGGGAGIGLAGAAGGVGGTGEYMAKRHRYGTRVKNWGDGDQKGYNGNPGNPGLTSSGSIGTVYKASNTTITPKGGVGGDANTTRGTAYSGGDYGGSNPRASGGNAGAGGSGGAGKAGADVGTGGGGGGAGGGGGSGGYYYSSKTSTSYKGGGGGKGGTSGGANGNDGGDNDRSSGGAGGAQGGNATSISAITSMTALENYIAYFTNTRVVDTTVAQYAAAYTIEQLGNLKTEANSKMNSVSGFSADVKNALLKLSTTSSNVTTSKIDPTYLQKLDDAIEVRNIKTLVERLKADGMGSTYDTGNLEAMQALYNTLKSNYDTFMGKADARVNDYNTAFPDNPLTKATAKAYMDQLLVDIDLYYLRELYKVVYSNPDSETKTYRQYVENIPVQTQTTVTSLDTNLGAAADRFHSYYTLLTVDYKAANDKYHIFSDAEVAEVTEFWHSLTSYAAGREEYVGSNTTAQINKTTGYYSKFSSYIWANASGWSNDYLRSRYSTDYANYNSMLTDINSLKSTFGDDEAVTAAFTCSQGYYPTIVNNYLNNIKAIMTARDNAQLDHIWELWTDSGSQIDQYNYTIMKEALSASEFDRALDNYVSYANASTGNPQKINWLDSTRRTIHNTIATMDSQIANFPVRSIRYADEHPYENDIARVDGEDYVVTHETVADTITKLDNFITSNDFATMAALKDKTGAEVTNLSDFIEKTLNQRLFTNKMVNTLVTLIFPMVCDALDDMIAHLPDKVGGGLMSYSSHSGYNYDLDLETLEHQIGFDGMKLGSAIGYTVYGDDLDGVVAIALDGNKSTQRIAALLSDIGLNIYPQYFASSISGVANSANFRSALTNNAKLNWHYFDKDGDGKVEVQEGNYEEDKFGNVTVNQFSNDIGDLMPNWGVNETDYTQSYTTFLTAAGYVFNAAAPLLRTALCNAPFSGTLNRAAYLESWGFEVTVDAEGSGILPDFNNVSGSLAIYSGAHLGLDLTGLTLYQNLWIPLMTALGVNRSGYDVSTAASKGAQFNGSGTGRTYKFRTLSTSASTSDMLRALFEPLLVLIDQLKTRPIYKVCEMLPQLLYFLQSGKAQELINQFSTHITLTIHTYDFDLQGGGGGGFWSKIVGYIITWFEGPIERAIDGKTFGFDLALNSIIKLEDLLCPGYTNINTLIPWLLDKLSIDLSIPYINTQNLFNECTMGSVVNKVQTLNPDIPDVFFVILSWAVNRFIGDQTCMDKLLALINSDSMDEKLVNIIHRVSANCAGHPEQVLAALVELFNPYYANDGEGYDMADFDEYSSPDKVYDVNAASQNSIVYLTYGNDWDRDLALTWVDNLEGAINGLIGGKLKNKAGESISYGEALDNAINTMFSNSGLASVAEILAGLGETLAEMPNIARVLESELGSDLLTWYRAWTVLFDKVKADADEEGLNTDTKVSGNQEVPDTYNDYATTAQAVNGVTITRAPKLDDDGAVVEGKYDYTFSLNGVAMVDEVDDTHTGSQIRQQFVAIFCKMCQELAPVVGLLMGGEDIGLFANAITIKGYKGYEYGILPVFRALGVDEYSDLMTGVEYANATATKQGKINTFNTLTNQLFNWIDSQMTNDNFAQKILEFIPRLLYFTESNGLSVALRNVCKPLLVLVDTIRPLVDLDHNKILAVVLSQILTPVKAALDAGSADIDIDFDSDALLNAILGDYTGLDTTTWALDLEHFTLVDILGLVDKVAGTSLATSPLVYEGIDALCEMGKQQLYVGVANVPAGQLRLQAADTLTILLSSLIETLDSKVTGKTYTNGERIVQIVEAFMDEDSELDIGELYTSIMDLVRGRTGDVTYQQIDWLYPYGSTTDEAAINTWLADHSDKDDQLARASQSAVYLQYRNNWDEATAGAIEQNLQNFYDMLIEMTADTEGNSSLDLANLIVNGILSEDEKGLYTGEIFTSLVAKIVELFAKLDKDLITIVDATLNVNLSEYYGYCSYGVVDEDGGETVWYDDFDAIPETADIVEVKVSDAQAQAWNDAITDADSFVDTLVEVLTPVKGLLGFILFGGEYAFLTESAKLNGTYTKDDLIVLNGGQGYKYGLTFLLEAIGAQNLPPVNAISIAEPQPAGTIGVMDAVRQIGNSLMAALNRLAEDPVKNVMDLLPELIYFINADGLTRSLDNLAAPFDGLLAAVAPMLGDGSDEGADASGLVSLIGSAVGADLSDLSMNGIFDLVESIGLNDIQLHIPDSVRNLFNKFFIGEIYMYDSASGLPAFKMGYLGQNEQGIDESRRDMITLVLTTALLIVADNTNEEGLRQLLGDEKYEALISLFGGEVIYTYNVPNWDFAKEDVVTTDVTTDYTYTAAELQAYADAMNTAASNAGTSVYNDSGYLNPIPYLDYDNDWTRDKGVLMLDQADAVINAILAKVKEDSEITLARLIKDILAEKVYNDKIFNDLAEMIANAVSDFGDAILLLDLVLDTDLKAWIDENFEVATKTDPETGLEVLDGDNNPVTYLKCVKEWNVTDSASFAAAFSEFTEPVDALLGWLLFGQSYKFFYNSNGEDMLVISGGEGHDNGVIYLLEALGCEDLHNSAYYYGLDGDAATISKAEVAQAVEDTVGSFIARLDSVVEADKPAKTAVALLPNFFYFVSAGGLGTAINGLLKPVNTLLNLGSALAGKDISIEALLANAGLEIDLDNLGWDTVFELLKTDELQFTIPEATKAIISNMVLGELQVRTSVNTKSYIYADASADGYKADVITVFVGILADIIKAPENAEMLIGLLGSEQKYEALKAILDNQLANSVTYAEPDWDYWAEDHEETTQAKGDELALPTKADPKSLVYLKYENNWDQATAQRVDALAIDLIKGLLANSGTNVADIISNLLEENIYTLDLLQSVASLFGGAMGELQSILGVAGAFLGADIEGWIADYVIASDEGASFNTAKLAENLGMTEEELAESVKTKDGFIDVMITVLSPLNGILEWLLFGDSYTFFSTSDVSLDDAATADVIEGNDFINIPGDFGYEKSIVYILEALGCTMPTVAQLKADAIVNGTGAGAEALGAILDALLTEVDEIGADPIDKIVTFLPNLLYFIDAGGLVVAINNLLAPVDATLAVLAPFFDKEPGELGVAALIGDKLGDIDIFNLDMAHIIAIIENIEIGENDLHIDITDSDEELLKNFWLGKLDAFDSANNLAAYRMSYNADGDIGAKADMLTVLLSIVLETASAEANRDVMIELLKSEDAYNALMILFNEELQSYSYVTPNWDYLADEEDAPYEAEYLATYAQDMNDLGNSCVYLEYDNDWNKNASQTMMVASLDLLINAIFDMIKVDTDEDGTVDTLGGIIKTAVYDTVYKDSVLTAVIEAAVNAVADFADYLELADAVLGTSVKATWFSPEYVQYDDAEGKYVCVKDFGIDSAAEADKPAKFANAVATVLEPVNPLLAWFLFGEDYRFFYGADAKDQIVLKGVNGYDEALVILLEALGVDLEKSADDFLGADGKHDVRSAITNMVTAINNRISDFTGESPAAAVIDLLPNIIYAIGSGSIVSAAANILSPVESLLAIVNGFIDEDISVDGLLESVGLGGIDLEELDWAAIAALVENYAGIVIPESTVAILNGSRIGALSQEDSVNGRPYVKAGAVTPEDMTDIISVVMGVASDIFKAEENKDKFVELLGSEGKYDAVIAILNGEANVDYDEPNWDYLTDPADENDQQPGDEIALPAKASPESKVYLAYANAWDKGAAEYVDDVLLEIIDKVCENTDTDLAVIIKATIADAVYTKDVFDAIANMIATAVAKLDENVVKAAGAMLDVDVQGWLDTYVEGPDADGKYTFDNYALEGVRFDSRTGVTSQAEFVSAVRQIVAPLDSVLTWLLLGKTYEFFSDSTAEGAENSVITVNGGFGYDRAIVYLLDALGCTGLPTTAELQKTKTVGENDNVASGGADALVAIVEAVLARADEIANDPIAIAFDVIPNLIYFINSGAVGVIANNLLAPADALIEAAAPFIGDDPGTAVEMISDAVGFDINNVSMQTIIDIVEDLEINGVRLDLPATAEDLLKNFYLGKLESYDSVNGLASYKMVYNAAGEGDRADMITIVLSLALDILRYRDNADILGDYSVILKNMLALEENDPAQGMSWYKADKVGETINAVKESGESSVYGEYWTQEKALYVADHFKEFLDNIFCLLGIKINGIQIDSFEEVLESVISDSVYTQANADKIIGALGQIDGKLSENLQGYDEYLRGILINTLGLDLKAWDNMTVSVTDGDGESFKEALKTILAPATPLLALILTDYDLSFFVQAANGEDAITIPGSKAYAYSFIPLYKALAVENIASYDTVASTLAAEYEAGKETCEYGTDALDMILQPIVDKIDEIEAAPADTLLEMLPELIYFINSNGVDTIFMNAVTTIDTVLEALYPAFKSKEGDRPMTTEELIPLDALSFTATDGTVYDDVRIEDIDFDWVVDFLLVLVQQKTGITLTKAAIDPLTQVTNGTLKDIRSEVEALGVTAGDVYNKGAYNGTFDPFLVIESFSKESDETKAAFITAILFVLVDFITNEENAEQINELLDRYIESEKTKEYVWTFIQQIAKAKQNDTSRALAIYTIYYAFVGASTALEAIDDSYHDVSNYWAFINYMLGDSSSAPLNYTEQQIRDWLARNMPDIADTNKVAPNGFIAFFKSLVDFFKRIIETFKRLFGAKG